MPRAAICNGNQGGSFAGDVMAEVLADEVADLLREVGETLILPRYGALEDSDIDTKSGPDDLVTIADREAELWLTPRLRGLVD